MGDTSEIQPSLSAKELRDRLLGPLEVKPRRFVDLPDGARIYLKNPTVSERDSILAEAGYDPADMKAMLPNRMKAIGVVRLAVDENGGRIFADRDLGPLMAQETGGAVDVLGPIVLELLNAKQSDEKKG